MRISNDPEYLRVVMARAGESPRRWSWKRRTAGTGLRTPSLSWVPGASGAPCGQDAVPVVPSGSRRLRARDLMKSSPTGGLLTSTPSRRTRRWRADCGRGQRGWAAGAQNPGRGAGVPGCVVAIRELRFRASCGGYSPGSQPSHRVAPRGGCVGPALPLMTPRPAVGPVAVAGLVTASGGARPVVSGSRPISLRGGR